jgi:hypothetical protein
MSSELSNVSPPKVFWLLLSIGIILASEIAAICSIIVSFLPSYIQNLARPPFLSFVGSLSPLLVTSPFAGLLVGLPCWWLLIERPKRATIRRGVVLGALSSIVAHPLMWTLLTMLSPILGGGWTTGSGLLQNIQYVIFFSLMGLIYVGWITAAVGGVAGALLIRLRRVLSDNQKEDHP